MLPSSPVAVVPLSPLNRQVSRSSVLVRPSNESMVGAKEDSGILTFIPSSSMGLVRL